MCTQTARHTTGSHAEEEMERRTTNKTPSHTSFPLLLSSFFAVAIPMFAEAPCERERERERRVRLTSSFLSSDIVYVEAIQGKRLLVHDVLEGRVVRRGSRGSTRDSGAAGGRDAGHDGGSDFPARRSPLLRQRGLLCVGMGAGETDSQAGGKNEAKIRSTRRGTSHEF